MKPSTIHTRNGSPVPLGSTSTTSATNFAVYARELKHVSLLLKLPGASDYTEIQLDPAVNHTGHVWHVEVRPAASSARYMWCVGAPDPRWKSNLCLDPYALALDSRQGADQFNVRSGGEYAPWAIALSAENAPGTFDWQDVPRPRIPRSGLVIYEMHVRGFTRRDGGGTFLDIVSRIPYLRALGVNAIELLPVMEFNEEEWSAVNPVTSKPLCQYWGYSTVSFFALMNRFGRDGGPGETIREFQYMVRELHRAGIEVILDVVYNHTAEMGIDFVGPGFYGMKQLAPFSYYLLRDNGATFVNFTGCGNTVNCNNVAVQDLIIESLRYFAHTLGVDGFRFDLASVMTRGTDGEPMQSPPLIERMAKDPSLRDTKLFAEPWDVGGLYQVGSFPHYGVIGEWNGKFRDTIRQFVNGDSGVVGEFATRMCGSQDLYGHGRRPYHSLNFVTAHDGFTLWDLVSYNEKHNFANGEQNRDGEAHNHSWNCGVEGDTQDKSITALRSRQIRNFLVALLVSTGTPMLTMGDEYGHSRAGNNNGWCHDGPLSWFDWGKAKNEKEGLARFTSKLIWFRRRWKTLCRDEFLTDGDVIWHGVNAGQPEWTSNYNFLAMTLKGDCELYIAFNCGSEEKHVELPRTRGKWGRVVDTNLEPPRDFADNGKERHLDGGTRYGMVSHSCLILRGVSSDDGRTDEWNAKWGAAFDKLEISDVGCP